MKYIQLRCVYRISKGNNMGEDYWPEDDDLDRLDRDNEYQEEEVMHANYKR